MGDKWKEYKIGDVAEVIGGGTPSTKEADNFGGTIPWLTPKDLSGYSYRYISHGERNITEKGLSNSSAKILPAKSVLLTTRAPVGYVAIAKNPVTTNQGFRSLVLREGFNHDFFYYLLKSNTEYLKNHASGTTFAELSGSTLKSLSFIFPSFPEQKAIASILGALDDKIELNRKMNETLETTAKAIFKSWFVDFDLIPGFAPHKEWQDSSLGKIPKGWRVGNLGDLVDFVNERVEATPEKDNEKYIALDDMPHRSIDLAQFRSGSEVNSSIIKFREGDILFGAMRPYFHKVGLAQFDGITRTTTFVLRPKQPHMRLFALMNLFSDAVIEYATNASVGSTIPYVRWDALSTYQISMPPDNLIRKFDAFVQPMINQIKINSNQSCTLVSIRDTLLPKLLSGGIRVKDAEKYVESVA